MALERDRQAYRDGVRDGRSKQRKDAGDTTPDWTQECEVCGATPVVPLTGLCGPCTFGEADTAGGNW
jgi:hypothetical protein